MDNLSAIKAFAAHISSHKAIREGEWIELAKWLAPHRGIFAGEDLAQRATHRQHDRFNQVACQAVLQAASGMTSGMTPRNSSWFKPDFANRELNEISGARAFLDDIDSLIKDTLTNGGFYQAIQCFNTDLIWAGCALLYSESCPENVLRFECVQIGTFSLVVGRNGLLDAVCRNTTWTLADLARKFGREALSSSSQQGLNKNPYQLVRVYHLVRRRDYYDPGKLDKANMPWESFFWEEGGEDFLGVGGYREMPYFFTRWNEGINVYGTGPGDDALPDARQLQALEVSKIRGIEKIANPPMQAPFQLKGRLNLDGGAINYVPDQVRISPILDLSNYAQSLQYLLMEIQNVSRRLQNTLMASIFQAVPMDQRPHDMSATEFLERKREMLQQLGPVMNAYEPNVLIPCLQRVMACLDRAHCLPQAPEGLQAYPLLLNVEFISPMANALRQSAAEVTRALVQDVAGIVRATGQAEPLDKLDLDQAVDELAQGLGAPGKIVKADSEVAKMRQERKQQQAQQVQAMQAQQALQTLGQSPQLLQAMEQGG